MPNEERRLILANGERLVERTDKTGHGRASDLPRSYDEARARVVADIGQVLQSASGLQSARRYPEELVVCFRLHPDMLAKSYEPDRLFIEVPDLRKVGSRNWRPRLDQVAQTDRVKKERRANPAAVGLGRLIFVEANEDGYRRLLGKLNSSSQQLSSKFREDIRKIEKVDFLGPEEQILGFDEEWVKGRVEMVLHPTREGQERQKTFLKELFEDLEISPNKSRSAFYGAGPGFISVVMTKDSLQQLGGCNPLRTVHPLDFKGLSDLRSMPTMEAPPPPVKATRSTIKVGVFDGGVDPNSPHLNGFVEEDISLAIQSKPMAAFVSHGNAVAGAVLYGSLDKYDPTQPLPSPPVSVVSIRAFPPSAAGDIDLFECIDVIERAVPIRKDISVFNISFGPRGPILDDSISRFTYALDQLAVAHNVLFFVAVGNDGDQKLDRIQAPSDLVHGIGVGAFTFRKGVKTHASYSCKGPGREGAKIKPDIAAFGGCTVQPFHLLALAPNRKLFDAGTSYASPVAASLGAQTNGLFDRSTPLLARALLTHCATHPDSEADHLIGHGFLAEDVQSVLNCSSKNVTIAFQEELKPKEFYKLVIPIPDNLPLPGTVKISWTIAAMCPVDLNHPGDYTVCCIEDTFYPHSDVYRFSLTEKGKKPLHKILHLKADQDEIKSLNPTWKRSEYPQPRSGNVYPTEQAKRAVEYKWDTIVRRSVSIRGSSLQSPFLVLHAIGRHAEVKPFPYAAVVTISAPKFPSDLHNEIVRRYPVLQPIRVKTEAEIRVQV